MNGSITYIRSVYSHLSATNECMDCHCRNRIAAMQKCQCLCWTALRASVFADALDGGVEIPLRDEIEPWAWGAEAPVAATYMRCPKERPERQQSLILEGPEGL